MIPMRRLLNIVVIGLCAGPMWAAAQTAKPATTQAGTGAKPEDWHKHSDRKALMLREMVFDADSGKVDAMIPLALTLLSGWGRAEGPHPQAAIFWFNAAADRGEHKALRHLAVVYAAGEAVPRDEKKVNAYLDAYAAKTGKPIKSDDCGEDDVCARYRELLMAYSATKLEIPRQARDEKLGGEFHAVVDLATKQVKVTGAKNLEVYEPALRKAVEVAVKQIVVPAGLADRRKTVKLSFDLQV
jgi:uncharacterized protein YggU (UPF0235/DUF167 family)